jgi:Fur family transcriptional regulator, peroxide stress response regulator
MSTRLQAQRLAVKLAGFEETCRAAGLKVTRQRQAIFQELAQATDHPGAEAVHRRVRALLPHVSLDTVYRTLASFEDLGLIYKVPALHDESRYDPDLFPHQHIVCRECGVIWDFVWEEFEALDTPPAAADWGRIEDTQAVLRGVCHACRAVESPHGQDHDDERSAQRSPSATSVQPDTCL